MAPNLALPWGKPVPGGWERAAAEPLLACFLAPHLVVICHPRAPGSLTCRRQGQQHVGQGVGLLANADLPQGCRVLGAALPIPPTVYQGPGNKDGDRTALVHLLLPPQIPYSSAPACSQECSKCPYTGHSGTGDVQEPSASDPEVVLGLGSGMRAGAGPWAVLLALGTWLGQGPGPGAAQIPQGPAGDPAQTQHEPKAVALGKHSQCCSSSGVCPCGA